MVALAATVTFVFGNGTRAFIKFAAVMSNDACGMQPGVAVWQFAEVFVPLHTVVFAAGLSGRIGDCVKSPSRSSAVGTIAPVSN